MTASFTIWSGSSRRGSWGSPSEARSGSHQAVLDPTAPASERETGSPRPPETTQSPKRDGRRGSLSGPRRLPSPCERHFVDWEPHLSPTLGAGPRTGQRGVGRPCGKLVDNSGDNRVAPVQETWTGSLGAARAVERTRGRSSYGLLTSDDAAGVVHGNV